MSRPRIGLALGSGAARGWSHIGVIRALAEAGIEPDIICGSSIGAFVGAAYVADELDAVESLARSMTWRKVVQFLDIRLSGGGLIEGQQFVDFIQGLRGDTPIESFSKPFAAIATDLATGREVWLQKGSMAEAVRASIALPGIFSPVKKDGDYLIDGGIVNPVPVSACRAMGAKIIIAVNLNGDLVGRHGFPKKQPPMERNEPEPHMDFITRNLPNGIKDSVNTIAARLLRTNSHGPGYFDVIAGGLNIMQDHITRSRLAGEPPHVMLMPKLGDIGLMEFARADECIAEGKRSVERMLPALRDAIGLPQA